MICKGNTTSFRFLIDRGKKFLNKTIESCLGWEPTLEKIVNREPTVGA
jgi:hypothetical protein